MALTVLAATAVLSGLAPARVAVAASAAKPVPQAQASGQDYATTVRVHLTVTPGAAGENAYVAWVDDYDSGDPLDHGVRRAASSARCRRSPPSAPSRSRSDTPPTAAGAAAASSSRSPACGRSPRPSRRQAEGVTVPLSLRIRPAAADCSRPLRRERERRPPTKRVRPFSRGSGFARRALGECTGESREARGPPITGGAAMRRQTGAVLVVRAGRASQWPSSRCPPSPTRPRRRAATRSWWAGASSRPTSASSTASS